MPRSATVAAAGLPLDKPYVPYSPVYVNRTTQGSTTFTMPQPPGSINDTDIVLSFYSFNANQAWTGTPASGWAVLQGPGTNYAGSRWGIYTVLYWHRGAPSTWDFTVPSTWQSAIGGTLVVRNAYPYTGDPWYTFTTDSFATGGTTVRIPSIQFANPPAGQKQLAVGLATYVDGNAPFVSAWTGFPSDPDWVTQTGIWQGGDGSGTYGYLGAWFAYAEKEYTVTSTTNQQFWTVDQNLYSEMVSLTVGFVNNA